jgi:chemotaxis protein methyltransferase CheR
MPDASFPILNAQYPITNTQFPIPHSPFPITNSPFPIPHYQFPITNSHMTISVADFDYIRKLVYDRTGVFLSEDKTYLVESRLGMLAKESGANSVSCLVAQLKQKSFNPLYESIVEAMMTNETFFFRDVKPFEMLRMSIIPELLKKRQDERTLNIWCGACSSGQEPYSIAILLREYFPELAGWKVQIIASDISTAMLKRASSGSYQRHEVLRGLSTAILHKYFHHCGKEWQIKEELRKAIEFRKINLTEPFRLTAQMDIIFLRNVLIYFDIQTKQSILARVRKVLQPDGYLFLGGGETTVNLDNTFEPIQFENGVCYRLNRLS